MSLFVSLYRPSEECNCRAIVDDLNTFLSEYSDENEEFILTTGSGEQFKGTLDKDWPCVASYMFHGNLIRNINGVIPRTQGRESRLVPYKHSTLYYMMASRDDIPVWRNIALARRLEPFPFSQVTSQIQNIFPQALLGLIGEYYGPSLESLLPPPRPKDPWFEPQNYGIMHI